MAGRVLRVPGAGPLTSRLGAGARGAALVYHLVGDPQQAEGERLNPALGAALLRDQVVQLSRAFRLVRAGELRQAAAERRRGQPYPVAMTFDDDLRSHLEVTAPVLEELGASATFFLCGNALGAPHSQWFERFDRALDRGLTLDDPVLPPADEALGEVEGWGGTRVDAAGEAVRRLGSELREGVAAGLLDRAGPDPPEAGLRAEEVRGLAARGFEIGFHTRKHHSLTDLDDDRLHQALLEGRQDLEEAAGRPAEVIAYPHGRADARVADAARQSGFAAGFTTAGGAVDGHTPPLLLPRIPAPQVWGTDLVAAVSLAIRGRGK